MLASWIEAMEAELRVERSDRLEIVVELARADAGHDLDRSAG